MMSRRMQGSIDAAPRRKSSIGVLSPRHRGDILLKSRMSPFLPPTVELGYAPTGAVQLPREAQENWDEGKARVGVSLRDYLAKTMTPLRTVCLQPFLIEEEAFSAAEKIPIGTPPLPEFLLKQYPPDKQWHEVQEVTLAKARKAASRDGFRLPNSDEWEYACSAGSRTLFRWGDDCPLDCYPTEAPRDPDDLPDYLACFQRRKQLSQERLDQLRKSFHWNRFCLHVRPNAFGLLIAQNPYHWEVCGDGFIRGGDGGVNICGGLGFLAGWLPLASSFCPFRMEEQSLDDLHIRRVLSVPF